MDKNKKLGFWDSFLMAAGMTIGAGVITMTGFAIGKTGSGVFLAYILASVSIFVGRLPYVITSSVIPTTSAAYTYANLVSPKLGAAYLYVFFIGRITMAFLGLSFGSYLASLINIDQSVAAVAILTILYILNLFGIKNVSRVQNILTVLLLGVLIAFILFGLPKVNYSVVLSREALLPNGPIGVLEAVSIIIFGVGGAFTMAESASHVDSPQRVLPSVIFQVTFLIGGVLFGLIGLVASGILPIAEVANQPLTLVAHEVFPNSIGFIIFIVGGALVAITTTINASYPWYYNTVLRGCEDGWLPKSFAVKNKYGVPYLLLTIFWLLGILPIIFGFTSNLLSRLSSGLTLASLVIPGIGILMLPQKYPEQWKNSRFYMSKGKLILLLIFCEAILTFFIYLNFRSYPKTVLLAVLGLYVVSGVFIASFGNQIIRKNVLDKKYETMENN